jgi:hypothetical protein
MATILLWRRCRRVRVPPPLVTSSNIFLRRSFVVDSSDVRIFLHTSTITNIG